MRVTYAAAALCFAALLAVPAPASAAATGPTGVQVGIHLISFGNYDTAKGTYTMDVYLHFRYDAAAAPANFTAEHFEFMNGRAGSKELLADDTVEGVRDVWYRVQANLYSPPRFDRYPFDEQHLQFVLEDTVHTDADLVYVPMEGNTTIDSQVEVAGWNIRGWSGAAGTKEYPFGESYSRLTYTLEVGREPLSSAMRSFLPPVAFMLVAALSFFFDRSQATNRLTLGTGMLISAVAFHISQTVGLPALGALSLFDRIMVCVYAFIASTILVTTVMAFGEKLHLPEKAANLVNRRGAILSIAVPIVLFLLLQFL